MIHFHNKKNTKKFNQTTKKYTKKINKKSKNSIWKIIKVKNNQLKIQQICNKIFLNTWTKKK